MNHRRTTRTVVLTLALGLVDTGTAHAAPTANAAFTHAGAAVYAEDTVGIGCHTFGICNGAAAALAATATPRYLSTRADEPVLVTCRTADLARGVGQVPGRGVWRFAA